jgi:hypothetical protein
VNLKSNFIGFLKIIYRKKFSRNIKRSLHLYKDLQRCVVQGSHGVDDDGLGCDAV